MVMLLNWEYRDNLETLGVGLPRGKLNELLRQVWKETIHYWGKTFLPRHFTRTAYSLYPENYPKPKPGRGEPLVRTGTLRARVKKQGLSYKSVNVTTKGGYMQLQYGRPKGFDERSIKAAIAIKWAENPGMSYKAVERMVRSRSGYGKKNTAKFDRALQSFSDDENKAMSEFAAGQFLRLAKRYGKPRVRRSRRRAA